MNTISKALLLAFALVLCNYARGQELLFNNISNQFSLPSLECYNVTQDSQGHIWISTEQGLVRYDGFSATLFSEKNGLPEKAVYAVMAQADGSTWLATRKNRLLRYQHGKLSELPISGAFKRAMVLPGTNTFTFQITPQNGSIMLNTRAGLFKADPTGKTLEAIVAPKDQNTNFHVQLGEQSSRLFYRSTPLLGDTKQLPTQTISVTVQSPLAKKRFNLKFNTEAYSQPWRILTTSNRHGYFFSGVYSIVWVRPDLSHQLIPLESNIISLYSDPDGGIWVGTVKKGVYYYDLKNNGTRPVVSLRNYSVSGIFQDREANIWATTLEDGVFLAANKQVLSYGGQLAVSMPQVLLKSEKGSLWASNPSAGLLRYQQSSGQFQTYHRFQKPIYDLWEHQSRRYYCSEGEVYRQDTTKKIFDTGTYQILKNDGIVASAVTPEGTYLLSSNGIYHIAARGNPTPLKLLIKSTGKCITYAGHQTLLYGCSNGLYQMDTRSQLSRKISGIEQSVEKILAAGGDRYFICTKGDGLYLLEKGKIRRIDKMLKLPSTIFNDIAQDRYGMLWAASNAGIIKISSKGTLKAMEVYSTRHGMPSSEINKVAAHGDQLFFSSSKGIASLPLKVSLSNATPPLFSLAEVKSGERTVDPRNIVLPYGDNKLSIRFNFPQYNPTAQQFYYRLGTQAYLPVTGNMLALQHLSPGKYHLSAYGINSDGVKSPNKVELDFTVKAPFWQQGWAIALIATSLIGLALTERNLYSKRKIKKQREKDRINLLVAESKLSALQARMNPHFIFNAINSIQNYIFKNQPDQARSYLIKFSRLIRLTLQQSAEKFITLDKEIEYLNLYVQLEQLRFRDAFSYAMQIDPKIDLYGTTLPSMLVQPYVENAIWHGLMNLEEKSSGKLSISFTKQTDSLIIQIQDNGIGRKKSMAFTKGEHYVSTGMALTEHRLDTLKEIFGSNQFCVAVTDLYDANQQATGTLVTLTLSLTKNQHDN